MTQEDKGESRRNFFRNLRNLPGVQDAIAGLQNVSQTPEPDAEPSNTHSRRWIIKKAGETTGGIIVGGAITGGGAAALDTLINDAPYKDTPDSKNLLIVYFDANDSRNRKVNALLRTLGDAHVVCISTLDYGEAIGATINAIGEHFDRVGPMSTIAFDNHGNTNAIALGNSNSSSVMNAQGVLNEIAELSSFLLLKSEHTKITDTILLGGCDTFARLNPIKDVPIYKNLAKQLNSRIIGATTLVSIIPVLGTIAGRFAAFEPDGIHVGIDNKMTNTFLYEMAKLGEHIFPSGDPTISHAINENVEVNEQWLREVNPNTSHAKNVPQAKQSGRPVPKA